MALWSIKQLHLKNYPHLGVWLYRVAFAELQTDLLNCNTMDHLPSQQNLQIFLKQVCPRQQLLRMTKGS